MKLGVQIPNFTYPNNIPDTLKEIVTTVDRGGFESIWVMDHYYQIQNLFGLNYDDAMLEGYSTLNYFAGLTKNVKLGTLVTGVIYRNPSFLIKQVSTLDTLSKGRAYFGIGAAWYKEEAEAYGFPYPPVITRFEMLEETLKIAKMMWSDEKTSFDGKHFKLGNTLQSPMPTTKPHPPIMIGGMGEKKTLKFVAKYADATNLFMRVGTEVLSQKLDVLKRHCEKLGRDFDEIEKTALGTVELVNGKQTSDDVVKMLEGMHDIGIQHAILNMPNIHEITPIEVLRDEVLPAIADW